MRIRSLTVTLAALLLSVGSAHAKSPIQFTPDESNVLVNKAVGTEQWVLSLNVNDDTLTGNVFDTTGKPPTFFFCDVTWDGLLDLIDLQGQTLTLDCQVASGCSAVPCDATGWHALGGGSISLPGSFFLP